MTSFNRIVITFNRDGVHVLAPDGERAPVPAMAVSRLFGDALRLNHTPAERPMSWVVGEDAQALIQSADQKDENTSSFLQNIDLLRSLDATPEGSLQRWRFLVGLLFGSFKRLSPDIETMTDLETVFVLPYPVRPKESKKDGAANTRHPPFWLIYGLRRLRWPGRFAIAFKQEGSTSPGDHSVESATPFSIAPTLQHNPGTLIATEKQAALKDPVIVEIQADGTAGFVLAPKQAALPVLARVPFEGRFDGVAPSIVNDEPRLRFLLQRDRNGSNRHKLTVTRQTDVAGAREIGYIPASAAPPRTGRRYNLSVGVDIWGRLRVSVLDPLDTLIPIRALVTRSHDAVETEQDTHVLHVDSLLFPDPEDVQHLEQVSVLQDNEEDRPVADPVFALDATSFNGGAAILSQMHSSHENRPLTSMAFWPKEKEYVRNDVDPSDVRLLELALCVQKAKFDPDSRLTRIFSFEAGTDDQIDDLVQARKLADFGRSQASFRPGDKVPTFLTCLSEAIPDELEQLRQEILDHLTNEETRESLSPRKVPQ